MKKAVLLLSTLAVSMAVKLKVKTAGYSYNEALAKKAYYYAVAG